MPFLHVADTRIFYSVHGSGSPVLLHHGWCCDGQDWAWMIPALARDHQVITMDARGHGRSGTSADHGFDAMVGDAEALLDHLKAGPTRLIGHSLGGVVMSGLALRRPDLAACVVAVDPAYGHPPEFAERLAPLTAYLSTRPPDAAQVVQGMFGLWVGNAAPSFLKPLLERRVLGMDADAISSSFVGLAAANMSPRDSAGPVLAGRACPVLSFHSMEDSADWERGIFGSAGSRAVYMAGHGHWLQVEAAETMCQQILAWWAGTGID